MKNISEGFKDHLAGEVLTLATCWKLSRKDGTVFGFTDHDKNIKFDEFDYLAETGFTSSAVQSSASFAVDNMEIDGAISASFITEKDLAAGLYDFAELEIFMMNYSDTSQGKMNIKRGWVGEVTYGKDYFITELRGLTQMLSQKIGDVFSPLCRADFGDSKCSLNADDFKTSGFATSVISRQSIVDESLTQDGGYYNFGIIKFTSGENLGVSMEIKSFDRGGRVTLFLPMPFDISISDSFEITVGCDKNFNTCINKFDNALNFRGEPHIPGMDEALKTSGTL